jgi:phospholipase/carboxylesterase
MRMTSSQPGAASTPTTGAGGPKPERTIHLAGLRTTAVGPADAPLTLVLLHGYAMRPADLSPFAHSLGVPAFFLLPEGPVASPIGGQAWWSVDLEARESALARGPRDLTDAYPEGLAAARDQLGQFLQAVATAFQPRRIVLGGFSQGGMLALDWALRGTHPSCTSRAPDRRPATPHDTTPGTNAAHPVDALVLLSASRLATRDWQPHRARLIDVPVFLSHGTADQDLAFAAGERLRDFVLESGARTSWVPFAGGHEIPLVVWRGLRKFLSALLQ